MVNEEYKKTYIECYNLVMDIVEMVKNFIYPGAYEFERIDKNLPIDEQLKLIRKDLESLSFEKELPVGFMSSLEYFYPGGEGDLDDINDVLNTYFKAQLNNVKTKLETKYLPFLKLVTIKAYQDDNLESGYTSEEAWDLLREDLRETEELEKRVNDVIWSISDNSKEDIVNSFLQDHYKLNDIEFARYMNGATSQSSIVRKKDQPNSLSANFKQFDKYFEDIYGQDESIAKIKRTLMRNILFYNAEDIDEDRRVANQGPLATFMFYGPTGTGKTETAKQMAKFVFGNNKKMLILDMNAYKDSKVSASAIKGHPEGYVDSSKGTDFTRFLQNNDSGIIVLDEFEKSAQDVRELFMTMLDEGTFKDALGNTYDLSGYIFVATTNVSAIFENKPRKIGFSSSNEKEQMKDEEGRIRDELRRIFTAPIMNRFNNIIGFKEIGKDDAILICKNLINKLVAKFESKKFGTIKPSIEVKNIDEIVEIILEESNFKKDGVRSLKNVINDIIASKILEEIVDGKDKIVISANNGQINCTRQEIKMNKRTK